MHKNLDDAMDILRTRVVNAKAADVPLSIHWSDAECLIDIVAARDTQIREQRAYIEVLKAEIEHQKAVSQAELDTVHDLGNDYERALEDEQLHIQSAKIEVLDNLVRRLSSYTDRYGRVPFEYIPMAALEILAAGAEESDGQ